MIHQNHVFAIRPSVDYLVPDYLSVVLASIHGRRYFSHTSSKVGIATTSSSKVLDFPLPLKGIDEQKCVSTEAEKHRSEAEQLSSKSSRQLDLLAERKQALITAAVTGQLDVTTAGRATSDLRA
ncbi:MULTISPECIES: hypothetical protein [unclassified Actinopolyspora]|uniref:hypothetical protein n=1 Tax=unclassified Actinopolyspora TaxID=2639451 RepID=UPI0013F607CC|nr:MULTISPECIES: hypothetical protein [unclassified Actinopolyspora]NHD16033.1 hypothetical protein [Actinopolyspora sp. BKK2]NHE74753.1 hypothetical protein [Actinopolyspora sp. BKK1]